MESAFQHHTMHSDASIHLQQVVPKSVSSNVTEAELDRIPVDGRHKASLMKF